jgi:transcriptional regulator with XRE-family HTH domain
MHFVFHPHAWQEAAHMTDTIGTVLYDLRKQSGKTILQVASDTHTSPGSFSNWENDRLTPTIRTLRKLAAYYNVPSEPLINLAQQETPAADTAQAAVTSQKIINIEDFFDADTKLTFGAKQLPPQIKQLTLVFLSGVMTNLAQKE